MTRNRFLYPLLNLICIFVFIGSLFGMMDWALGAVIFLGGIHISTFLGAYVYSQKLFKPICPRPQPAQLNLSKA